MAPEERSEDEPTAADATHEAAADEGDATGEATGEATADEAAADEEPVVVTTEVQPDSDDVVNVQPEGEPEPPMLHGVLMGESRGQIVLHPTREEYPELVRRLRDEGYWACLDVIGVDYLGFAAQRDLPRGIEAERFEVVVIVLDHVERSRVRLRVQVPESDPTIASIVAIHPGAENPEREVFDMFGIRFEGHPDPSRILMPDEWEGHPLRKDEHSGRIPVQFKGTASGM
jgi:NADH-quinone oxidoreductase subunit C